MSNEETIKMMKARLKCLECDTNGTSENCEECYLNYEQGMLGEQIEWMKVAIKTMEQQPSDDCVSRKAMLDAITEIDGNINMDIYTNEVREIIRELPPVTPTRKKGKWEFIGDNCFRCSECGEVYTVDQLNHINNYCNNKFPKACPSCATEMESEE